jgi:hypothetical protein
MYVGGYKTRRDKAGQDNQKTEKENHKARQDKAGYMLGGQDKTRQGGGRQPEDRKGESQGACKTSQGKTRKDRIRWDRTRQERLPSPIPHPKH